jgi:hypothetical protein
VIHLVAQALGVPLFRRVISGQAVEQGSEYGGRNAIDAGGVPGDETEDMYALLSDVKVNLHYPSSSPQNLEVLNYSPTIQTFKESLSEPSSRIIRG